MRVHAQLIDTHTSAERWAESYLKALDDVFAIQSEIALAIVGQLQARLSPQEKTAIDQAKSRCTSRRGVPALTAATARSRKSKE